MMLTRTDLHTQIHVRTLVLVLQTRKERRARDLRKRHLKKSRLQDNRTIKARPTCSHALLSPVI